MKFRFKKEKDKISTISLNISTIILSNILSTIFKIILKISIFKFVTFFVTFSKLSKNAFFIFSFISFEIFTTIFQKSIIISKRSRFLLFIFKIILKRVKIASKFCSFISFATFSSRFRKSILKFYFIIDNFNRMFIEKFKLFNLSQHSNHRFFFAKFWHSFNSIAILIYHISITNYFLLFVRNQLKDVD